MLALEAFFESNQMASRGERGASSRGKVRERVPHVTRAAKAGALPHYNTDYDTHRTARSRYLDGILLRRAPARRTRGQAVVRCRARLSERRYIGVDSPRSDGRGLQHASSAGGARAAGRSRARARRLQRHCLRRGAGVVHRPADGDRRRARACVRAECAGGPGEHAARLRGSGPAQRRVVAGSGARRARCAHG